jgi:hypothetical protein
MTSENDNPTQCELILRELLAHAGEWVPMPQLSRASGAYAVHSRISNLRERGFKIETHVEGQRPKKSSYRLVQ